MNALRTFLSSRFRQRRQRHVEDDNYILPSIQRTNRRRSQHLPTDDQDNLDDKPHTFSFLYTLARRWAWEAVVFRCQTHPHEARSDIVDASGDTILHWTCFGSPPLHAVETLLETCPDLAKVANLKGNLPLHVACSYRASGDIIRALLKVYPEAAGIPNQNGSCALHLCCDYGSSVDSVLALVETQEGVSSLRRKDGIYQRTPLQILNERKNMVQFHQSLQHLRLCRQRQRDIPPDDHTEHARLEASIEVLHEMEFWNKARLLALAHFLGRPVTLEDVDRPGIVHACIGMYGWCPPSLREFAILLKVEELLQPDDGAQGRLPLHLACCAAVSSSPSVVAEVLRACPKAARIPDGRGRLAWSLFQEHHPCSGWSGTVQELVHANPLALETSDLDARLYPLIWSRFSNRESLAVLHESILGNPNLFLR